MEPTPPRAVRGRDSFPPDGNFSFVLGGPLFQLLRKARLSDDAMLHLRRRVIAISLLAWLPLLVLSAIEGVAASGSVTIPFLYDIEAHAKFLVALPLLIVSEYVVHTRLRGVILLFDERRLVPESAKARLGAAVHSAFRLRNSVVAEVLLIAFVYGVGVQLIWRQFTSLDAATWYATPSDGGPQLTRVGVWHAYVSLPLFQFLLCRWYFRVAIWVRFLWQVSRVELDLSPAHPDRMGGLGFLANTAYAFAPLVTAHGVLLAGHLANRILYLGTRLPDYKLDIGAVVLLLVCMVFGPLLVFAPQLAALRRRGLREYGTLASRYVREFEEKWLRGGAAPGEPLVGSADVQSLADLGNSFEVVRDVRIAPITREAIFRIAFAAFLPIAPLGLTMMPLEELLKSLLGVLF